MTRGLLALTLTACHLFTQVAMHPHHHAAATEPGHDTRPHFHLLDPFGLLETAAAVPNPVRDAEFQTRRCHEAPPPSNHDDDAVYNGQCSLSSAERRTASVHALGDWPTTFAADFVTVDSSIATRNGRNAIPQTPPRPRCALHVRLQHFLI